MLLQWFAVFAASVLFEFAYIAWLRSERSDALARATLWAGVVPALSLFGVLSAVHSYVFGIAYVAGAMAGTAISVGLRRFGGARAALRAVFTRAKPS